MLRSSSPPSKGGGGGALPRQDRRAAEVVSLRTVECRIVRIELTRVEVQNLYSRRCALPFVIGFFPRLRKSGTRTDAVQKQHATHFSNREAFQKCAQEDPANELEPLWSACAQSRDAVAAAPRRAAPPRPRCAADASRVEQQWPAPPCRRPAPARHRCGPERRPTPR